MAKLIALALAFSALVAFASAHTTTITTTTIEDENPFSRPQQCSRQYQGKRFNQCQKYLQQGLSWYEQANWPSQQQQGGDVKSCCQELLSVENRCQCEAAKEAFRQALSMQQQQQGRRCGPQQIKQMKQKAQQLPNKCQLQTQECEIGTITITSTTNVCADKQYFGASCQHIRERRFNQCQSYVQKQSGLLMSIIRKGQQTQGLEQCCDELLNVEEECQCEAMQEVYRQAQQQWKQQGGRQTQDLEQIVENLRNQCDLRVQQCRIPSAMF